MAVLDSLTMTRVVVPPLPVILTDDVSQKVWLSLISAYHGGAYPQDSLSFLACVESARTWHEHIYMVAAMTGSLM